MTGTVAHWKERQGYGFITPDVAGSRDIFCHISGVRGGHEALMVGDIVEFDTRNTSKGLVAVNVCVLNSQS